jgi:peroxiredoxin
VENEINSDKLAFRQPRRVLPILLIGVGIALLVGAVLAIYLPSRPHFMGFPRVGQRLPDFALNDLNGKLVHLKDYSGKTVLVNAWATWCPPCREEMPLLVAEYNRRKDTGFTVLAINAGETRQDAAAFAQSYGMSFPVLLDPDSKLLDSLLIDSLPTTILVGPDGRVKAVHIGNLTEASYEREILPFLSN